MNHLRKFYESVKEPIDVELDVIEFREKFQERLIKSKFSAWDSLDTILTKLVIKNPTMTDDYKLYQMWNSNMQRSPDTNSRVIKAVSEWHARIIVANKSKAIGLRAITDSGTFVLTEINERDIDNYITELEASINHMSRKLEMFKGLK